MKHSKLAKACAAATRKHQPVTIDAIKNIDYSVLEKYQYVGDSRQLPPYDQHTRTAAEHFGISPECVTPQQRIIGKNLNFLKLYNSKEALCGKRVNKKV